MNPSIYIAFFSGIFNLFVGFYLFLRNPKSNVNRLFILFVLTIVIFNIGEFFTRISTTAEEALFWGRISFIELWLGSCFAFHFSLIFPRRIFPSRYNSIVKYLLILIYIMGLMIYSLFFFATSTQNVLETEFGYRVVLSASSYFIVIFFLVVFGLVFTNLVYKFLSEHLYRIEKKQIKIILIGATIMVLVSLGTNLLPPLFNFKIFPMTSLFTSIFVVFVAYAIVKYRFLSLSPEIIAENILDTMKDLVIIANEKEDIVNVNKSTLKLLGYEKKDLVNYSLKQIIKLPEIDKIDDKNVFESRIFDGLFTEEGLNDIEVDFVSKFGDNIPMSTSTSPMYNNDNNLEGFVLVARDLTEVKKSLKEKEMLLREIHHRIKNNLQLISSLLDLQSQQTENKDVIDMFRESQDRIKLISRLHEQLYQSKNLVKINFREYIQNLTTNLFNSYKISTNIVTIKIDIPDIFMDVDTTLVCSLIVNELVSNSLKYAFSAGEKGGIIVDFRLDNNMYTLVVSDDGVGLLKGTDFRNTRTLGLQLVNMFVQQLRGTIQLDRSIGTKFIIRFKYVEKKKRGHVDGK